MSKFDTTSPTSRRGKQQWRFCVNDNGADYGHYIEISETKEALRSDRMVTKNICLRINDEQLAMMKNILDVYFAEGGEE